MSALIDELRRRPKLPEPAVARAIRLAAGASQEQVARELQVSSVTVRRWEAGSRRPTGQLRDDYCRLLAALREVA